MKIILKITVDPWFIRRVKGKLAHEPQVPTKAGAYPVSVARSN